MALKTPDHEGAFGCSACHDIVDGKNNNHEFTRLQIENWFFRAAVETRAFWLCKGYLKMVQMQPEKHVISSFDDF